MAIRHWHLDAGSIRINNFPENEIQIAIPITLLAEYYQCTIDSTGVKLVVGFFNVDSELVKHIKSAYLLANAGEPTATVELYNWTDGNVIAYIEYAGDSGIKTTNISADTLKQLVGKTLVARINVTTASATSGATQAFSSIKLVIKLGIS